VTSKNGIKTVFLLTLLTGLFLLVGMLLGGRQGLVFAFVLALGMNFFSYWYSDKIALMMTGAREVGWEEAPELHQIVEQLAHQARIPKPRVYIIDTPAANAFATGRDPKHAAVAVTTGIMRILNRDELAGVIAHELTHVRNRDTLIQTIVATIAGAIMFLANMARWAFIFGGYSRSDDREGGANPLGALLVIIVAPIAATLVQLAISRSREYAADEGAAKLTGRPLDLASALQKLEASVAMHPMRVSPAASHLFIVQPLRGADLASLFSTHPPVAKRVARLYQIAQQMHGPSFAFS